MPLFSPRALARLTVLAVAAAGCGGRNRADTAPSPDSARSTITSDQINPSQSPERALMGRFPGVQVSYASDGGLVIRIRGANTYSGGGDPLYLVDGMQYTPGPSGSLQGLNVNDIESIKVLKDPADLTMYGSRGANGVVLITTKKPKR